MIKAATIVLACAIVVSGTGTPVNSDDGSFVIEVRRNYFLLKNHLCNGALIDPQFVLIPANCVSGSSWFGSLEVVVGSKIFTTTDVIPHEDFKNLAHDIALIRLSSKVTFQETGAGPIRIPPANSLHSGDATLYKRNKSGEIETSVVTIRDPSECSDAPGRILVGHICAGDNESKAVKGDEGSPLVVGTSGAQGQTIIGFLSYAKSAPAPGVYTRVSTYSNWIFVKEVITSQKYQ